MRSGLTSLLLLLFEGVFFLWGSPLFGQIKDTTQFNHELSKVTNDSIRVLKIIDYTRALHRKDPHQKIEYSYARRAVDLALKTNNRALYARALDNLGLLYRYYHQYAQALSLHIKAYNMVKSMKKVAPIEKMIFANNAGLAARYNQEYDMAIAYYFKALNLAKKEKNRKNIAISSNGIGNALSHISGREEEALHYFRRALSVERKQNNGLGMAMDLLSISGYYLDKKEFKKVFLYLDSLYENNKSRNDKFGLAITDQFYGEAYAKEGQHFEKAKVYYRRSLRRFQALGNPSKSAEVFQNLGDLYRDSKQLNRAFTYFSKSLQIADSINNKKLISENAYAIAKIKQAQKDYQAALHYYQKANAYEDSIALIQQKTKIAALANQYKLNQKEAEIASLKRENSLKEELVNAQNEKIHAFRLYLIILVFGLLLILLFVYLQYRTRKAKKKTESLLSKNKIKLLKTRYEKDIAQAEMLATRSQMNPHFLFNCLTAIHLLLQKEEYKNADQYLIVLSRFFRMILELPESHAISLDEEIELIKYYITLEKNRFKGALQVNLKTLPAKEMQAIEVPPLLLQPYIENAIWHGLLPSHRKEKKLDLYLARSGDATVKIVIEDNGVGRNAAAEDAQQLNKKKSMGMKITRERIDLFNANYDAQIEVEVIDKKVNNTSQSAGTKVVLTFASEIKKEAVPA